MLKAAVFVTAAPAALVMPVIALALAVAVGPALLLMWWLDRRRANPPCQAVQQSAPR